MTSKRKLRAEIERLRHEGRKKWYAGYCYGIESHDFTCSGKPAPDHRPWAAHLARVADAAREQGRREGYRQALADIAADVALLRDMDHQPQPETTPEPHAEPDGACCGFACCCQHPPVAGWTPGSVTR